jgi:hypothetical protein
MNILSQFLTLSYGRRAVPLAKDCNAALAYGGVAPFGQADSGHLRCGVPLTRKPRPVLRLRALHLAAFRLAKAAK